MEVEASWQFFAEGQEGKVSEGCHQLAVGGAEVDRAAVPAGGVGQSVGPDFKGEVELVLRDQIMFGEGDLASSHEDTFHADRVRWKGVA